MGRPLLSAHEIVRTRGPRTILRSVSLVVDDRTRTALIGPNGAGKSTLLRILAGDEPPDAGRVVRARDAAVLSLPQLDTIGDTRPVRAVLHERLGVSVAAARMDALADELAAGNDVVEAHAEALEEWLARGGADIDARLDRSAAAVDLDAALLDRPAAELSGGQRARAMLAGIEAARAEVLLLDEPANHLDADGLARLRTLLLARAGGLLLVAHDRALLAAVSNHVVELDPHTGAATEFAGGWAAYERERERGLRRAQEAHARARAERDRLRDRELSMRGRTAGVRRQAAAEGDKHIRHAMRQSAQRSADGLAAGMARRAARVEIPDAPWEATAPALPFTAGGSRAGVIADLAGAVLARGSFVMGPVDLEVRDGDRVWLTGPNGCGKSTAIAALAGRLEPLRGRARRAQGAVAEVGQERGSLLASGAPDLVTAVRARAGLGEREARAALAAMGLDQALVGRAPGTLSPGERTRA